MHELSRDEFDEVLPLLSGPVFYPEAAGVIGGLNTGWVFVDRLHAPTSALVWVLGQECLYCLGDWANKEFVAEIARRSTGDLAERIRSLSFDTFDISGDSPGWDKPLLSAFSACGIGGIQTAPQYVYRYGQPKWRDVPERLHARPIDEAVLTSHMQNAGSLRKKVLDRWISLEGFLETGLGYCIVEDDRIASVCLSGWVFGQVHAVSVETYPGFRRRGLARAATAALFEKYEQRGIEPHWDVMPTNEGSIAIAESLGLMKAYEYNVHFFRLPCTQMQTY